MVSDGDCDVVLLGLGAASEHLAKQLAQAGLEVIAVERELVGGECPYWACVPTKMALRGAELVGEVNRARNLAGRASIDLDWSLVADRIRKDATQNWSDAEGAEQLTESGARLVRGEGRIVGTRSVAVDDTVFTARRAVIIGIGSSPDIPSVPGLADTPFWTNREAVAATEVPRSLAVMGGGPVGCEFAQMFARFGCHVTLVETSPTLLPGMEPQAAREIAKCFRDEDMTLSLGSEVVAVGYADDEFTVQLDDGKVFTAEHLLVATGRSADLKSLGVVEHLDGDANAKILHVDARCRVTEGVYALGDVTAVAAFTHTAVYQADVVFRDIIGEDAYDADYTALPATVFTDPEVASVGLTEQQAHDQELDVEVTISDLGARGWLNGVDGLIKTLVDRDSDQILGATAVAPVAGELIAVLQVAMRNNMTAKELRRTIWGYPTFAAAIPAALPEIKAGQSE